MTYADPGKCPQTARHHRIVINIPRPLQHRPLPQFQIHSPFKNSDPVKNSPFGTTSVLPRPPPVHQSSPESPSYSSSSHPPPPHAPKYRISPPPPQSPSHTKPQSERPPKILRHRFSHGKFHSNQRTLPPRSVPPLLPPHSRQIANPQLAKVPTSDPSQHHLAIASPKPIALPNLLNHQPPRHPTSRPNASSPQSSSPTNPDSASPAPKS